MTSHNIKRYTLDKAAQKCLKFQGYWMALDDGMAQLKANRLIQYQSDAFRLGVLTSQIHFLKH